MPQSSIGSSSLSSVTQSSTKSEDKKGKKGECRGRKEFCGKCNALVANPSCCLKKPQGHKCVRPDSVRVRGKCVKCYPNAKAKKASGPPGASNEARQNAVFELIALRQRIAEVEEELAQGDYYPEEQRDEDLRNDDHSQYDGNRSETRASASRNDPRNDPGLANRGRDLRREDPSRPEHGVVED